MVHPILKMKAKQKNTSSIFLKLVFYYYNQHRLVVTSMSGYPHLDLVCVSLSVDFFLCRQVKFFG